MAIHRRGAARSRLFIYAALAIAALAFAGFARSYYLRPFISARVISLLVHVHGVLMTAWVALFVGQSWLIARGHREFHRTLGIAGAAIAAAIVAVGSLTVARAIDRRFPGIDPTQFWREFVEFDGLSLWVFGSLVLAAVIWRARPDVHKRLMLAATAALLPPAIGRIAEHLAPGADNTLIAAICTVAFILTCATFDTFRERRLRPAMLVGTVTVIAANVLTHWVQISD